MIEAPQRTERLLEKSGRITPREVLEAYEETGLRPGTECFLDGDAACAFGVLMARDGVPRRESFEGFDHDALEQWQTLKTMALGSGYAGAFYDGFDGYSFDGYPYGIHSDASKGHHDGQRSRKAVLSRYGDVL
jgi:hypothetical protein